MKLLASLTASLLGLASLTTTLAADSFVGSNLYYAAGLTDAQSTKLLAGLQSAGVKVLRVWLDGQTGTPKGTPINTYNSLEGSTPQSWDDTVLNRLDSFMAKASSYGIKLSISLHSYNALEGNTDYYGQWYGTGDFYTNSDAIQNFKVRIAHVMAHVNPANGKTWAESPEYIFAFEAQNEAMHPQGNKPALVAWQCTMAEAIKGNLKGSKDILITTGGGSYLATSALDEYLQCGAIDVIAIHAYGTGDFATSQLTPYVQKAKNANKKLIMQEWGACYTDTSNNGCTYGNALPASTRDANIKNWSASIAAAGIPWFYWQIIPNKDPHTDWDYEVGIGEENWGALQAAALQASQVDSAFNFDQWLP